MQFSQHPGRYLPQVPSGPVGLASGVQTHMPSACLQNLQVRHFR